MARPIALTAGEAIWRTEGRKLAAYLDAAIGVDVDDRALRAGELTLRRIVASVVEGLGLTRRRPGRKSPLNAQRE
jgi:hypothetical protein